MASIVYAFILCQSLYIGELDGVISPASSEYILRVIDQGEENDVDAVIIMLDTPGGLDLSMRTVTKKILNAHIPVIVYVAPHGARAASAGVFILYASHIAAMAPGTNVGAAHPVSVGEQSDSVMIGKVTNDAVAYLQAIAKERGRNGKWAEQAVRESASIDAETALRTNVCDLIAASIEDLIIALNGRRVMLQGDTITIHASVDDVQRIPMTFKERLLLLLTNPTIAYILLLLGVYGLFFELRSPGMIFPGVIGGICIILGFYALHLLPVNYAGVALIALSALLFFLEIYITSHGLLTIGGIVSLFLGSLILFESRVPFLSISWATIAIVVVIIGAFFFFLVGLGIRAQFKKKASGKEGLIDEIGVARTVINTSGGTVFIHGEYWNARSEGVVKKGSRVKVIAVENMVLHIEDVRSA
ncbi:nodulation protein NfeD [candidate division WOR-3 bacterium]|nr:nodulation protein NfeD [candidate division WOR-3 bacterium]